MNWFDSRTQWHWMRRAATTVSIRTIRTITRMDVACRACDIVAWQQHHQRHSTNGRWPIGRNAIDCAMAKVSGRPFVYRNRMDGKWCPANVDRQSLTINIKHATPNVMLRTYSHPSSFATQTDTQFSIFQLGNYTFEMFNAMRWRCSTNFA